MAILQEIKNVSTDVQHLWNIQKEVSPLTADLTPCSLSNTWPCSLTWKPFLQLSLSLRSQLWNSTALAKHPCNTDVPAANILLGIEPDVKTSVLTKNSSNHCTEGHLSFKQCEMTKYFREAVLISRHYNSSNELGNQESNSVLQSLWQSYLSTTRFQKKMKLKMYGFQIQTKRHIKIVLHTICSLLQEKCNVQVDSVSRQTMLWTNVA